MFYRLKQFWRALFPVVRPSELTWAGKILPPEALSLFLRQARAEQRHALDVALYLRRWRPLLSPAEYETLLIAALLHDCGKSLQKLRLWQRVAIVLVQRLPARLAAQAASVSWLAGPLALAEKHPQWGGQLARSIHLSPAVCRLIATHHQPEDRLGRLLRTADEAN